MHCSPRILPTVEPSQVSDVLQMFPTVTGLTKEDLSPMIFNSRNLFFFVPLLVFYLWYLQIHVGFVHWLRLMMRSHLWNHLKIKTYGTIKKSQGWP